MAWLPPAAGIVVLLALAALTAYVRERRHRRTRPMSGGLHAEISLPYEEEFELYHNALSLCSKKVRVCLAELGLRYRSHPVDLIETGAYENLSRAFLAVNPAGTVPVLVHKGHPIYESHEQIRYASDHSADAHRLVPRDPQLAARMQTWVDRASLLGDDPTRVMEQSAGNCVPGLTTPLFAAMIESIPTRRILEGLLFHRLKSRPLSFLTLKWYGLRRFHRLRPAMRMLRRSIRHMNEHLDALEAQLESGGGPWILGREFSLADVSWMAIFERMLEADCEKLFLGGDRHPRVTAYWERLRARPSYQTAIVEHGHPTIARGTQRLQRAKKREPVLAKALSGR